MTGEVERATYEEQSLLLRAHPDLGTRARMSTASADEQSGAGLDRLTPEEYQRLQEQNTAYHKKFGFPFLYAVKGSTKYDILRALDQRLKSPPSDEFHQALNQVYRIALFRLQIRLRIIDRCRSNRQEGLPMPSKRGISPRSIARLLQQTRLPFPLFPEPPFPWLH